jgi:Domain of unknown function (DUF4832)/Domain of unknown function (DUF4874)
MLHPFLLLFCSACFSNTSIGKPISTAPLVTATYQPSSENFTNPERGFYIQRAPLDTGTTRRALTTDEMLTAKNAGMSMLRLYLLIDEHRDSALSQETLDFLQAQFSKVREQGMKIIPRFAYNFPTGGTYPYQDPDAPLTRVLEHISQLEPLLQNNADVIAFMEIGFVGAWGEWHSSTNQLVNHPNINDASRAIVNGLLQALPKTRMLAMRYPPYKQQLFDTTPLTESEAFSGSNEARVGAHNDCFLASNTDWGTYPDDATKRETIKAYLEQDNRYLPQGGETCNNASDALPYTGCENALRDLTRLRYATLNRNYLEEVYARWDTEGCFEDIKKRLGYRFSLIDTQMPETAKPGEALPFQLSVKNEGFAALYNPRGLSVMLRNQSDNSTTRINITDGSSIPQNKALDPRFWAPGQTTALETSLAIPGDLKPGKYDVLLHLYDPTTNLKTRAEYAIRLANTNIWEASTGLNKLRTLEIKP